MQMNIGEVSLNYIQYGKGKDIILLHGWGQNIEMMKPLGDLLSINNKVTIIDLPGFGKSSDLDKEWNISDYTSILQDFIKNLKIKKPILIGHSFGGRVAIRYAATNPTEKVVLFGAPCIRRKDPNPFKTKILKTAKKIPGLNNVGEYMKKYIGSRDYKNASPELRQTLVNTVNEDQSKYAKMIQSPTLLIWGENDTEAPAEEAKELENIMVDASLIILPGTHYAYLENINHVATILNEFFKEKVN